jgi:hypothetical protein
MWPRVKKFLQDHRKQIVVGMAVVAVGYVTYKYFTNESDVKLSAFVKALKEGYIEEVVVEDKTIYFRAVSDQWFQTFMGSFPRSHMVELLKYC